MAAKGSILKQEVSNKILAAFPGSFLYNDGKEIRINGVENGVPLQIKVVLTASKTAVDSEGEAVVASGDDPVIPTTTTGETVPDEPSEDEKARLAAILEKLGL